MPKQLAHPQLLHPQGPRGSLHGEGAEGSHHPGGAKGEDEEGRAGCGAVQPPSCECQRAELDACTAHSPGEPSGGAAATRSPELRSSHLPRSAGAAWLRLSAARLQSRAPACSPGTFPPLPGPAPSQTPSVPALTSWRAFWPSRCLLISSHHPQPMAARWGGRVLQFPVSQRLTDGLLSHVLARHWCLST